MNFSKSRRVYDRKDYNAEVKLAVNNHTYFAELKNISLGGALISMSNIPPIEDGDDVSVTIPFAYQPKEVQLKARVMRYAEQGLGVSFF